jgi:hypothetical protein
VRLCVVDYPSAHHLDALVAPHGGADRARDGKRQMMCWCRGHEDDSRRSRSAAAFIWSNNSRSRCSPTPPGRL